MKKYPLTCIKTSGLKKVLDIFSNFDVTEVFSQRNSLQDKKTDILPEVGAKFCRKESNTMYLYQDKNCQSVSLKVYKQRLYAKLKEYALHDCIINKIGVVFQSDELKKDCDRERIVCGNDNRFIMWFENIPCDEDKLEDKYDELDYNKLISNSKKRGGLGLPKSILIITKLLPYYQYITVSEKDKQYLINLHPHWKYREGEISLTSHHICYTLRNIIGQEYSFVATFGRMKTSHLELLKVE